jgi:UDP-GlcNAc:undecaprenyl-phosphate GlcNAc-1-phosphate transferase
MDNNFLISCLLTVIITSTAIAWLKRLSLKLNLVDQAGGRKLHQGKVPVVGGLALFSGFAFASLTLNQPLTFYRPFFACGAIIVLLGLADDLHDVNAYVRLLGQIAVACMAMFWGGIILDNLGPIVYNTPLLLSHTRWLVSLAAFIGLINAINMLDGHDGLAGSLCFIQLGFMALLAYMGQQINEVKILLVLMLAIMVFLYFNFPSKTKSARIFMGDAGSMFLGFTLTWFTIHLSQPPDAVASPVTFLWIMAVPLFDFFNVVFKRLRKRRSPLQADREHIHHILGDHHFNKQQTLFIIIAVTILMALLGCSLFWFGVRDAFSFGLFLLFFILYLKYCHKIHCIFNWLKKS